MSDKPEALRLAEYLGMCIQEYPQQIEEEPVGYCTEQDQVMAEAAAELRRLHAECERLRDAATFWESLYRRAVNQANGLTNYVEDRPELRSAERKLEAIELEARTYAARKGEA